MYFVYTTNFSSVVLVESMKEPNVTCHKVTILTFLFINMLDMLNWPKFFLFCSRIIFNKRLKCSGACRCIPPPKKKAHGGAASPSPPPPEYAPAHRYPLERTIFCTLFSFKTSKFVFLFSENLV